MIHGRMCSNEPGQYPDMGQEAAFAHEGPDKTPDTYPVKRARSYG